MKISNNPSALESQKRIIESLIDLMQVKNIKDISISEISENAEVVRRTFYRNFKSKEDVLDAYFNNIYEEFKNTVNNMGNELDCLMTLRELFKICYKHKDFFMALKKNNMLYLMLNKWNVYLPIIYDLFLDRIVKFPDTKSKTSLEYLLAFNAGGVFNMVIKWIDDGMVLTPSELADITDSFAYGTLYKNI